MDCIVHGVAKNQTLERLSLYNIVSVPSTAHGSNWYYLCGHLRTILQKKKKKKHIGGGEGNKLKRTKMVYLTTLQSWILILWICTHLQKCLEEMHEDTHGGHPKVIGLWVIEIFLLVPSTVIEFFAKSMDFIIRIEKPKGHLWLSFSKNFPGDRMVSPEKQPQASAAGPVTTSGCAPCYAYWNSFECHARMGQCKGFCFLVQSHHSSFSAKKWLVSQI